MLTFCFYFLPTDEEETGIAPEFVQPIKPQVAKPSQVTELKSVVSGKPAPVVTWYRDNVEIVPDEKHTIIYNEETGQTVLTITDTSPLDECVYTVEATNPFGNATCRANVVLSEYFFSLIKLRYLLHISMACNKLVWKPKS